MLNEIKTIIASKHPISTIFYNLGLIYRVCMHYFSFKKIGRSLKIQGRLKLYGDDIIVGNHVSLNEGVILNSHKSFIKIGNYCTISAYSQLHTSSLTIDCDFTKRKHIGSPIILEEGVWLCAGVIVNPGVKIGKGSVIASGSVVTKNIPSYELWGGVPAKKIKKLAKS